MCVQLARINFNVTNKSFLCFCGESHKEHEDEESLQDAASTTAARNKNCHNYKRPGNAFKDRVLWPSLLLLLLAEL